MIFRDDDIFFLTKIERFKRVDSLFMEYGIEHHIAILCNRFEEHTELIDYIRKSNYKLNDWEKQFMPQVELHYRVSNKQAKCLEGIYAKSVGGG